MPTASRPLNIAAVRASSVPSYTFGDLAQADDLPVRSATISLPNSSGVPEPPPEPDRLLVHRPVDPPDGRGEVLLLQRATTWATLSARRLQLRRPQLHHHVRA